MDGPRDLYSRLMQMRRREARLATLALERRDTERYRRFSRHAEGWGELAALVMALHPESFQGGES